MKRSRKKKKKMRERERGGNEVGTGENSYTAAVAERLRHKI